VKTTNLNELLSRRLKLSKRTKDRQIYFSIVYMHNATEVDSPSDVLHLHKVIRYSLLHLGL